MTLTPEQVEERRLSIGSSDIPALFGYGFKGQDETSLWMDKMGAPRKAMTNDQFRGHQLEEATLRAWCDHVGADWDECFGHNEIFRDEEGLPFHSTPDLLWKGTGCEAKTVSHKGSNLWGPTGSGKYPPRVFLQCQHHMMVHGSSVWHVACMFVGYRADVRFYVIRRSDEVIGAILKRGLEWWDAHVVTKTPPTDGSPDNRDKLARFLYPEPTDPRPLSTEDDQKLIFVASALVAAHRAKRNAEDEFKRLRAQVELIMGNRAEFMTPAGGASWKMEGKSRKFRVIEPKEDEVDDSN